MLLFTVCLPMSADARDAAQIPPPVVPAQLPSAVTDTATQAPAPAPNAVTVGVFVNDIHELDFRTNTYSVDLYVWFRWRDSTIDPAKTMEFMNRYMPTDHQRDVLLDEPQKMPDGSFYNIVREQGRFSSKFVLQRYPFDRQVLKVIFEDTVGSTAVQRYVPDGNAITGNPDITLPGYDVERPQMAITAHRYPTNFGDISLAGNETYSRVAISIPITRPLLTVSIKTFVPILLIVISSMLVLYVRPKMVEGRIGLAITALLTLVALQLTAAAALPDVDYLMLIDKAYLASYAFIIAVLMRVVVTSWVGRDDKNEEVIARNDGVWALFLLLLYASACGLILAWTLARFPS